MNHLRSILIVSIGLFLCGCSVNRIYDVTEIPRTPENLKAIRECQRTLAVATGYTQEGYKRLKSNCYKTLDDTSAKRVIDEYPSVPGCELIDSTSEFDGINTVTSDLFLLCK